MPGGSSATTMPKRRPRAVRPGAAAGGVDASRASTSSPVFVTTRLPQPKCSIRETLPTRTSRPRAKWARSASLSTMAKARVDLVAAVPWTTTRLETWPKAGSGTSGTSSRHIPYVGVPRRHLRRRRRRQPRPSGTPQRGPDRRDRRRRSPRRGRGRSRPSGSGSVLQDQPDRAAPAGRKGGRAARRSASISVGRYVLAWGMLREDGGVGDEQPLVADDRAVVVDDDAHPARRAWVVHQSPAPYRPSKSSTTARNAGWASSSQGEDAPSVRRAVVVLVEHVVDDHSGRRVADLAAAGRRQRGRQASAASARSSRSIGMSWSVAAAQEGGRRARPDGRRAAPSRRRRVIGRPGWLRRPWPRPSTSTPEAASRSGEPMAPADTTTRSASTVTPVGQVHTDGPPAVERDGADLGAGDERDVRTGQVGVGGGDPPAVTAGEASPWWHRARRRAGPGRAGPARRRRGPRRGTRTRASASRRRPSPTARTGPGRPAWRASRSPRPTHRAPCPGRTDPGTARPRLGGRLLARPAGPGLDQRHSCPAAASRAATTQPAVPAPTTQPAHLVHHRPPRTCR